MATKNKIGLNFSGFKEVIAQLDELEGDIKKTTEKALTESKKIVTEKLIEATIKENFPAKGKYSTGATAESINKDMTVEWDGMTASIPVGYDLEKSGLTSIFLMYGTPRHKPPMPRVSEMFDAIYGAKTKKEVKAKQKEIFENAIKERLG